MEKKEKEGSLHVYGSLEHTEWSTRANKAGYLCTVHLHETKPLWVYVYIMIRGNVNAEHQFYVGGVFKYFFQIFCVYLLIY